MSELTVRAFGISRQDLDLDFEHAARPQLVTRVLEACLDAPGRQATENGSFWDSTVGDRIAGLLQIILAGGGTQLEAQVRCIGEDCGETIETELPVEEVMALQREPEMTENVTVQVNGEPMSFRRPTGIDQREWLKQAFSDEGETSQAIVRSLLIEPAVALQEVPIPPEAIDQIEESMQRADPLVNFQLEARCPNCGTKQLHAVDLQELALRHLHGIQQLVLAEVHQLAMLYHWSESEILAISAPRRRRYLSMLERAGAA
jgi:hypothetical protein